MAYVHLSPPRPFRLNSAVAGEHFVSFDFGNFLGGGTSDDIFVPDECPVTSGTVEIPLSVIDSVRQRIDWNLEFRIGLEFSIAWEIE